MQEYVWVFVGNAARFPAAIFSTAGSARQWISRYALTGTLTRYPVDVSVYDWAIEKGFFTVRNERHSAPEFIGGFSTAYQEHYHFVGGMDGDEEKADPRDQ